MRNFEIEEGLKKKIAKMFKKDRQRYDALMKKIDEILNCEDVEHYKNLRSPLQHLNLRTCTCKSVRSYKIPPMNFVERVHINSSYVLLFKYVRSEDLVVFYDFEHHDKVYR